MTPSYVQNRPLFQNMSTFWTDRFLQPDCSASITETTMLLVGAFFVVTTFEKIIQCSKHSKRKHVWETSQPIKNKSVKSPRVVWGQYLYKKTLYCKEIHIK